MPPFISPLTPLLAFKLPAPAGSHFHFVSPQETERPGERVSISFGSKSDRATHFDHNH
jgi:hypothetical protein